MMEKKHRNYVLDVCSLPASESCPERQVYIVNHKMSSKMRRKINICTFNEGCNQKNIILSSRLKLKREHT